MEKRVNKIIILFYWILSVILIHQILVNVDMNYMIKRTLGIMYFGVSCLLFIMAESKDND